MKLRLLSGREVVGVREVAKGTLRKLIARAGVTVEGFLEAMKQR